MPLLLHTQPRKYARAQLDENMRRAHARDAVHTQKFFFRKHMADLDGDGEGGHCRCTTVQVGLDLDVPRSLVSWAWRDGIVLIRTTDKRNPRAIKLQEYEEMTVAEIMTGKGKYFPGLIPLCEAYLAFIQCDRETREKVRGPLNGRCGWLESKAWRVLDFLNGPPPRPCLCPNPTIRHRTNQRTKRWGSTWS